MDTNRLPDLKNNRVAAIIPAHNCAGQIEQTVKAIPPWVKYIIVIDDFSSDNVSEIVKSIEDDRIQLIRHKENLGVGAAFITGADRAIELEVDILVKMDGDGQMDPEQLPRLLEPVLKGRADYTKGNRFWNLSELKSMPRIRILGNMLLSFFIKMASGYWQLFDPANGYVAMTSYFYSAINRDKLDRRYFFESSMLIQAGIQRFMIEDVPIPARYGSEKSHLSLRHSLFYFPPRLIKGVARRFMWQYLLFDFTAVSVFIILGLPALLWGFIFGLVKWIHYVRIEQPAPTGTIMLSVLPIIIGIQLISQAIVIDIGNVPQKARSPLKAQETNDGG